MANENTYRPRTLAANLFVIFLVVLGLAIFAGFAWMALKASDKRMANRAMVTDFLCETQIPCRLILTAEYDSEPMDLALVSPKGESYGPAQADVYNDNGSGLITMELLTQESGSWNIKYNQKTNNSISFHVRQEYAKQVFLTVSEPEVKQATKRTYLTVTPQFEDGSDTKTKIMCNVTLTNISASSGKVVYSGQISLNRSTRVQLDIGALPEGIYYIDVSTSGGEDNVYKANSRGRLTLGPDSLPVVGEPETDAETQPETTDESQEETQFETISETISEPGET